VADTLGDFQNVRGYRMKQRWAGVLCQSRRGRHPWGLPESIRLQNEIEEGVLYESRRDRRRRGLPQSSLASNQDWNKNGGLTTCASLAVAGVGQDFQSLASLKKSTSNKKQTL
jgi:hypothetical protein